MDSEIRSRLQPEVVRQTGMNAGRVVGVVGVGGHRQQRVVDIGRRRIALDVVGSVSRPVMVFHHNDEDGLDVMKSGGAECVAGVGSLSGGWDVQQGDASARARDRAIR